MASATNPLILGIETSCDETAAAVVSGDKVIHAHTVWSQVKEHLPYGGVVPEIAARAHMEAIEQVLVLTLKEAGITLRDLDAIAATSGPGLIGGVIVGCMTGKTLAAVNGKPFIAVNHLEGHALTIRLTHEVAFPYLMLLVSGGHCQFLLVEGVGQYQLLGQTLDDALGEAFDKTAKMLGLPYPGGPQVEKLAALGNPKAFDFPTPLRGRPGCDFSFSGLKTAVRMAIQGQATVTEQTKADICASFQRAIGRTVSDRLRNAIAIAKAQQSGITHCVLAGGVAANQFLRGELEGVAAEGGLTLLAPPMALCTDNAAMIAWAGIERYRLGRFDGLDFEPRARWPLSELS